MTNKELQKILWHEKRPTFEQVVDIYHNNVSIKNITNYYDNETKKELQERLQLICSKL